MYVLGEQAARYNFRNACMCVRIVRIMYSFKCNQGKEMQQQQKKQPMKCSMSI